jgi:hypothetical protein
VRWGANAAAWPVALYIRTQRDRLSSRGTPLSAPIKEQLSPYFASADLDRVRVVETDPLPIPRLPFRQAARRLGLEFLAPERVAAITFDYVIASRQPMAPRLLFHELVHVVQFRLLGVSAFARLYTRGFVDGSSYLAIPLERCASDLECRFDTDPSPFDVEPEVARWIADAG